jgi:GR25 family glycosyltransferase involved in LPS biosynthesis
MAQSSINNIKIFMIVINRHPVSEFYYNHCITSWRDAGFSVERFKASTPDSIARTPDLFFARYNDQRKYINLNLRVSFSETEKACFTSHFRLWKKCALLNEPILILEHDTELHTPSNLWVDVSTKYGFVSFDEAAMGCYVLYPWFAKILIDACHKTDIFCGPLGFIREVATNNKILDKIIFKNHHKRFTAASNQVMSTSHGRTIDHYYITNRHLFSDEHPEQGHNFKYI